MSNSKNIFKKLDYDSFHIGHAQFLPPRFDDNMMYVLPPINSSIVHT